MMKVNLSLNSQYHTQKNNEFIPFAACGPTSAIMSLKAAKIYYYSPKVMQEEDYLTANLNGIDAWRKFEHEFSELVRAKLWPNNVSRMLQWGITRIVGRQVDTFKTNGTLREMIWHLYNRRPLIMSGSFTKSGHFVSVVGFESLQHIQDIRGISSIDLSLIESVIVDDPYGKYPYVDKKPNGNNTGFSLDKFNELTNTSNQDGRKWLHIISDKLWEMVP